EGRGIVRPHERTFPKAKTDRLSLLRATRTNTSPVFALFADEKGAVAAALEAWMVRGPAHLVADARIGEERHLLWALDDRPVAEKLTAALKDQRVYLADGHHRYETGLAYLKEEIEAGKIDFDEDSTHFILAYLCALEDPGLQIFATHRIVRGATASIDAIGPRNFEVADAGERLPQKTTYFYPKVPAGLVLRPLGD